MTLDERTERRILEIYNAGRGRLPRATTVGARPNRRRLASLSRRSGRVRLNVADAVVRAGPPAWALLGAALGGDRRALARLTALCRDRMSPPGARRRRRGRAGSPPPLPATPCEGTASQRRTLLAIVAWAKAVKGCREHFPPDLQIRVSRRMTRSFGTYMARGGAYRITLSSRLFRAGLEDILLDTTLHELAHLLHARANGRERSDHGPAWREWCRRLGARPRRLAPREDVAWVERANRNGGPGAVPAPVARWLAREG